MPGDCSGGGGDDGVGAGMVVQSLGLQPAWRPKKDWTVYLLPHLCDKVIGNV